MKHGSTKITLSLASPPTNEGLESPLTGEVWLSEQGLLNFLETRLGVSKNEVSFTSRLVDYLNSLEQVKSEELFFYQSYKADPFAVARKLLLWRDELYLAGWTGVFRNSKSLSQRLLDLEVIEKVAQGNVSNNIGQRWQYVLSRLTTDDVFISQIMLKDALEYFPPLVQQVVKATKAKISLPASLTPADINASTDLQKVQSLINEGCNTNTLDNDGSLLLIETEDIASVATTTAYIIGQGQQAGQTQPPLVIAESNGPLLDERLEEIGLPRAGFTEISPWRPVFQVLPLALDLIWEPVNPRKILQFLTNPICPLSNLIRFSLGNLVAEKPGIGGPYWRSTIEEILANASDATKAKQIRADIKFWLECEKFDASTGAPTDVIQKRITAVSNWLATKIAISEDLSEHMLFATAKGQTEDLSSAVLRLEKYNDGRLTKADLRRLIDDIRGVGAPLADRVAEISVNTPSMQALRESGGVFKPHSEIIWSGLSGYSRFSAPFITDAEREQLREQNIQFVEEDALLASLRESRYRPVLMSKDRLVLITPNGRSSDHPVWTRIITAFPNVNIYTEKSALDLLGINRTRVQALNLPPKQREWQLPASTIIPKAKSSSFSSLEKFLFKPHQWILGYPAKIRSGSLSIVNDGNRLKGNLAHRLIEDFLNAHTDLQTVDLDSIVNWSKPVLETLIKEEGATLLEEGSFKERVEFISIMERALKTLITHLVNAGVTTTETEKKISASFIGGPLEGSIDILAVNSEGAKAIIDVKYGLAKYRREELKNSQYLQLATYDRLTGSQPHLSYFSITDACMLNLSHSFFNDGENITPDLNLSLDEYWSNIEVIWSHRHELYNNGIIEVPVEGTEPNSNSVPNGIVLDIPETNDRFSEYAALTGWEDGA